MTFARAALVLLILWPSALYGAEESICSLIKETIAAGRDTRTVVRSAIELGHNSCLVVACAAEGQGDPKEILGGAIEAGVSSAVVSRCAVNAGLDPGLVAGLLLEGDMSMSLCYFGPSGFRPEGVAAAMVAVDFPTPDPLPPSLGVVRTVISPIVPAGI